MDVATQDHYKIIIVKILNAFCIYGICRHSLPEGSSLSIPFDNVSLDSLMSHLIGRLVSLTTNREVAGSIPETSIFLGNS